MPVIYAFPGIVCTLKLGRSLDFCGATRGQQPPKPLSVPSVLVVDFLVLTTVEFAMSGQEEVYGK